MVRARMAVWLLAEPLRVTKARILSLGSCTVSDGVRSSASSTPGTSMVMEEEKPQRISTTRRDTSRTSVERAFMYSSSMEANTSANSSPVSWTAWAALSPPSMRPSMAST